MNRNDLKNPLIQSGAILLFAFLLISIVAGSGSEGIGGSIGALISGLVSAVVFIVALCLAIIISIAVIIGIYVAAVSIYSVDKGRDLIDQLKSSLLSLSSKFSYLKKTKTEAPAAVPKAPSPPSEAPVSASTLAAEPSTLTEAPSAAAAASTPRSGGFEEKIDGFNKQVDQISEATASCSKQLDTLQRQVDDLSDTAAAEDRIAAVEETQQTLKTQLDEISAGLESNHTELKKLSQQFGSELEALKQEVASLHEKTSVPEVISGILSYIDSQEDRDLVTEKAKEAISRNMTYSQIDDFFKDSLPSAVYQEIAAHPRLTKDFLRSIKKKF